MTGEAPGLLNIQGVHAHFSGLLRNSGFQASCWDWGSCSPRVLWDEDLLPTVVSPRLTGILLKQSLELGGLGLGSALTAVMLLAW